MEIAIDPISIQIVPTMSLLGDTAQIAVEGGINYWAQAIKYKWEGLPFPELVIVNISEPDEEPMGDITITPEMIRKGMQLAMTPGILHPESNTFRSVYSALTEQDSSYLDADAADNVLQLGIFGKLVYA